MWAWVCLRYGGRTSASRGIRRFAATHLLVLMSSMYKLKTHAGSAGSCSAFHSDCLRILLRSSACMACGCSRLFQSAIMCPSDLATASDVVSINFRPTGLRQEPQFILNTTPELSHAIQKTCFGITWCSRSIATVGGNSSFTNMSLRRNWCIRGLHLPVTCSPALQKPKPASPDASDCIIIASCSSSRNQMGVGLYL